MTDNKASYLACNRTESVSPSPWRRRGGAQEVHSLLAPWAGHGGIPGLPRWNRPLARRVRRPCILWPVQHNQYGAVRVPRRCTGHGRISFGSAGPPDSRIWSGWRCRRAGACVRMHARGSRNYILMVYPPSMGWLVVVFASPDLVILQRCVNV